MQAHTITLSEDPNLSHTLADIIQLPDIALNAVFEAIHKTPANYPPTTCHTTLYHEPKTYKEAMTCLNTKQWRIARDKEYNQHIHNGTWEVVDHTKGIYPIPVCWVWKHK